jgi:hypothetical protein
MAQANNSGQPQVRSTAPTSQDFNSAGLPAPPFHPQHPYAHPHAPQPPRMPFGPAPGAGMNFAGQSPPNPPAYGGNLGAANHQPPGFAMPFQMNEHMRQAFANHMQQHESIQRAFSQGQHLGSAPYDSRTPSANDNEATTTGYQPRPSADATTNRNNGNTLVREGHGPNGQWRIVMNQTTMPAQNHAPGRGQFQPSATGTNSQNSRDSTQFSAGNSPRAHPFQTGMPFPLPVIPFPNIARFASQHSFPPTVYLLSSPAGYQAILIPSHPLDQGLGSTSSLGHAGAQAPPIQDLNHPGEQEGEELREGQEADPQQRDEAVDILRIVFPLGGHLWLLIRLAGLVYLIAGGATWTRTILLSTLAFFVFIGQAGWLTPVYRHIAEPIRRHLEGVIRADPAAPAPQQHAEAPGERGQQDQRPPAESSAAASRNNPGVTPEQVALRLLREREERNESFLRASIRRFERSLALFVASLVPGVGEGHVAAQQEAEQAQRRREQEQEVEQRRALESAQQPEPGPSAGIGDNSSRGGAAEGTSPAPAGRDDFLGDGAEHRPAPTDAGPAIAAT